VLTCKDVSFKISKSLDIKLSLSERIMVKTHLLMCKSCRRFSSQMQLLHIHSKDNKMFLDNLEEQPKENLPEDARQRIMRRLDKLLY